MTSGNKMTHMQGMQQIIEDINKAQIMNPISSCVESQEIKTLNDKEQAELDRFKGDTNLKRNLTFFVVCFTSVWSIGILTILFFAGFGKIHFSDAVLIAILTETLATVLGLPLVVTSHFFPKQK